MRIQWVTLRYANGIVNAWHSHLPPARGCVFSLGAFDGAECVGVVICARPSSRGSDNGLTFEITRLATNGHRNAASALLGRARRVAGAMGVPKLISYTLESEAGTSYIAAGWSPAAVLKARAWKRSRDDASGGRHRTNVVATQSKIRWEITA